MSFQVLAFHGTSNKNINPICEKGFLVPGKLNLPACLKLITDKYYIY